MNRILKLAALALLPCLALSCGKKNNEEPKPEIKTGKFSQILPDENGQRVATAPIAFSLAEGKEFSLNVEGVGDLALVGAYATSKEGVYTAGKSGKVGIEGSLNIFDLTSDDVTEVKVQKSSPALKRLVVLTKGYGNSNLKSISLDNAPNLTYLWLGGHELSTLDLTKQEKLVLLGLGSWGGKSNNPYFPGKERSSDYKKVLLPANNAIEYISARSPLTNESIDLDNLPKLKVLRAQSPRFSKLSLAKSNDIRQIVIMRPYGGERFDIDL